VKIPIESSRQISEQKDKTPNFEGRRTFFLNEILETVWNC
jgi:hypothetical protein